MSDLKEAAQQALTVLETATSFTSKKARDQHCQTVANLRAALQPPASYCCDCGEPCQPSDNLCRVCLGSRRTQPPADHGRKPLTDEQIDTIKDCVDWSAGWAYFEFTRAIEAAHGITNKDSCG